MAILGSATYELKADNTRFNRDLAKAEKSSRESSKRISKNLAKAAAGLLTVGAGIGFGLFRLAKAASSAQEAVNAVNVEFEEGAHIIHKFAKNSAQAVGLASGEFMQIASQVGALFRNYGLSAEDAAKQTIILTTRAADLASVGDTSVKEALNAMASALRGETEPIRRFSVDVTDATLEMYLLSQGIEKSVTEMSQAEKGMHRYGSMMEQSKRKAGDFAATSGDAANSSKILTAQLKNAAAMMGQGLLPVLEPILLEVRKVVTAFSGWAEKNPELVRTLVLVAAAVAVLATAMGGLVLAASGLALAFGALGVAGLSAVGWIGVTALAVIALVAAGVWLVKNWDKVKTSLVSVFETVLAWVQPVVDAFALWAENNPKLMRALVIARQAVAGLTMALGWLRQQAEDAWEAIKAWAEDIWEEHLKPIWEKFKETWAKHVEPAVLWLVEKFEGLPGAMQLALLGAAAGLAASMTAMLAVWTTKMLVHLAVWTATSLAHMAVWAARMLVQFAAWTAAMLVRMALWPAKMLVHLAVWTATSLAHMLVWRINMLASFVDTWVASLARMAVWTARMLAQFAVWTATSLARMAVWAAGAQAAWVAHYARLAGARLVFLAGALAAWVAHYARLAGARLVFLAGALAAWVAHYARQTGGRLAFLAVALAAWVAHYALQTGAQVVFLAASLARMTVWAAAMAAAWLLAMGPVGWAVLGVGAVAVGAAVLLGGGGADDTGQGSRFDKGGGGADDTDGIPGFAKGGIVTGPTLARLGEAGPEAVVPLSGKVGMGGNLTILFQGDVYGGEDFGDRVRDAVDEATRRGVVFGAA